MRWKTTLALLLTTIGIGAYISLYEIRQPDREEHAHLAKRILDIQPDAVTQLGLDLPKGKVTLSRHDLRWQIGPSGVRADETLVTRILNELTPLMATRVLSGTPEHPLDTKTFGLDPAVGWLSVVANGKPVTLFIGGTTPVESHRYLRVSDRPEIFVVPSSLFDAANQPTERFRDPLLIRVNGWLVEEVRLTSPTVSFALLKQQNEWRLMHPFTDRADRAGVTTLLNTLGALHITRFLNDAPPVEQLSAWGFDHPKAEISLRQGNSSTKPVTLFVGNPLTDDPSLVYAKRSDEPSLYAVADAEVEQLLSDPQELRSKACFDLFTATVTKVEVSHEGSRWVIERTGDQWREAGTGVALDTAKVETLLRQFSDVRLSGFVDDTPSDLSRYGLHDPSATIAVWTSDPEHPQRLLIGSAIEGSTNRYGRIEGRDAVIRLPDLATTLASTPLAQLRPAATSPASPQTPVIPPAQSR